MSIPSNKELLSIFSPSELFHSIIDDTSVLFRFIYKSATLNFLLYDYKSLYYCSHSNEEILSITKSLNPSLEYDSLLSLVILLKDNLVSSEGLSITKITNENKTIFTFEFNDSRDNYEIILKLEEKVAALLFEGLNHIFIESDDEEEVDIDTPEEDVASKLEMFFKILQEKDNEHFGLEN